MTAADVDFELTDRRSLVLTWLNRGTLHLVRTEDYPWLHALTTPPLTTSNSTRLRQEGVSQAQVERAMGVLERCLADEGPLTRVQLRDRLEGARVPVAGQALIQLLFRASAAGICVRGPMIGRQHAYVLVRDWIEASDAAISRDSALAELARRYLAGHGPASDRDLARWAGLPLRDARRGLEAIAGSLVRVGADGLVDLAGRGRAARLPPPRLLGTFEPVLLGWTSRADVLRDDEAQIVTGGIFRGFAMVGGRAVAMWRLNGRDVEISPFDPLSAADGEALERDGAAVQEFLGLNS
jgi:hypothetical protein